jgi:hypothetical protein
MDSLHPAVSRTETYDSRLCNNLSRERRMIFLLLAFEFNSLRPFLHPSKEPNSFEENILGVLIGTPVKS